MSWARVGAGCRWDAVELLAALPQLRAYLVQADDSHWTLHVERDRDEHDLLGELLPCVESWLDRRFLPATLIEVSGRAEAVHAGESREEIGRLERLLLEDCGREPAPRERPLLEHELCGLLRAAVRRGSTDPSTTSRA